jgi:putative membrane protein
MMWHANDGMGWWMVFGGVFWLLFWASIIYVLFYAVTHREHRHDGDGDAMEIARRRLARGEITPQEFEEIAKRLRPASASGQH